MEGLAAFQPESDGVSITDEGIAQMDKHLPAPIRSGGEVIRLWSDALSTRQAALLKGLFSAHPRWVERRDLVKLSGYSESMARKIGSDLQELSACNLADEKNPKLYRLNPNIVEIPFSRYR